MIEPGKRNLITDVEGLKIGNAEDAGLISGTTVLIADQTVTAVADVRGGAPGTRDVEALDPVSLVAGVDAIVLSGGSAFGLDAPSGVQSHLRAQGRGFQIAPGAPLVPIGSGAILFDLANGGNKDWGDMPPYRDLGRRAAENASRDFKLGNVGAGMGAACGIYKGGLGSVSSVTHDGFTVGAVAAANAVGSPVIPGTDAFWAYPFEQKGEFGGRVPKAPLPSFDLDLPPDMKGARVGENTTIAIVATDAALTQVELKRLAIMATDGFPRAIRPIHTPFDGDLLFAVATGRKEIAGPRPAAIMRLGMIAGDCIARAIARGVYEAQSLGRNKSYREIFGRG
ncbi:MAG: P1 family peptidase [Proteobacteria bacterium]|nr:P1 family peptidase [Pseudomonadota bacterium]